MEIFSWVASVAAGIGMFFAGVFGGGAMQTGETPAQMHAEETSVVHEGTSNTAANTTTTGSTVSTASAGPHVYTHAELLALAGDDFANGLVPLGDKKYSLTGPKKGYVYLCRLMAGGGGAEVDGSWIGATTWQLHGKPTVDGSVSWPNASFSNAISGLSRIISGNALPKTHTTGIYPVKSTDDAYKYDRNPNTITAQSLKFTLPANPTYSDTPYCMGGEAGIMLSGVPLFNSFDAELRDAAAHEIQDSCDGHPQEKGEYHYHSLSSCFKDTNVETVLGFAYDGFPITGPVVEPGKYLTTSDLDECHGLTSEVVLEGKRVTTYHYVMTYDFPYSVSCFRGKPVSTTPSAAASGSAPASTKPAGATDPVRTPGGTPPPEATAACSGKSSGATCSFSTPQGTVSGVCDTPPGASLACIPH